MPTVEIDGRAIHYLTGVNGVAPERRSIVFVHGAGGNGMVWQNQRRGLDRGPIPAISGYEDNYWGEFVCSNGLMHNENHGGRWSFALVAAYSNKYTHCKLKYPH